MLLNAVVHLYELVVRYLSSHKTQNVINKKRSPRGPFQLTMKTLNLGLERPRSLIYIVPILIETLNDCLDC